MKSLGVGLVSLMRLDHTHTHTDTYTHTHTHTHGGGHVSIPREEAIDEPRGRTLEMACQLLYLGLPAV